MVLSAKQLEAVIDRLKQYAESRRNNVARGLGTVRLSALLVEKYAWGISETLRALDAHSGSSRIIEIADKLCFDIDPDFRENRQRRYETKPPTAPREDVGARRVEDW